MGSDATNRSVRVLCCVMFWAPVSTRSVATAAVSFFRWKQSKEETLLLSSRRESRGVAAAAVRKQINRKPNRHWWDAHTRAQTHARTHAHVWLKTLMLMDVWSQILKTGSLSVIVVSWNATKRQLKAETALIKFYLRNAWIQKHTKDILYK